MSINIGGLPSNVVANWNEWGFNAALYLATVQQRGADSSAALTYFSAVVTALQAIGTDTVTVPAFGAPATVDYAYGLSSLPPLSSVGKISLWAVGRSSIKIGVVSTISDWAYGKASIPSLAVVASAT